MYGSQKQAERRQRGEDFQNEIRRSWRLIPNCWRLRITDGVNRTGSRPADELLLLESINILCEEKRTAGDRFELSFLRPNQLRGLLEFDAVLPQNKGLVFVSFLNADTDTAYAFCIADATAYMKEQDRQYIALEEFKQQKIKCVHLPVIVVTDKDEQKKGYDLKGVQECYR